MTVAESVSEIERQVRWLMTLRGVTVTTLLVCAFAVELLLRPADTLRPLFTLAAVAYGMVLLYAVLHRWLKGTRLFVVVQLVGDALVVTFFVAITGGIDSPMSFLYLLPIAVASLLLYRGGGLALAGVCWSLYAALAAFGLGWSPLVATSVPGSLIGEPGRLVYVLVAHLVGMFACALLSAYLAERMQAQGREIAEHSGTVARLKALNENIIESINSGLITTGSTPDSSRTSAGDCWPTSDSVSRSITRRRMARGSSSVSRPPTCTTVRASRWASFSFSRT